MDAWELDWDMLQQAGEAAGPEDAGAAASVSHQQQQQQQRQNQVDMQLLRSIEEFDFDDLDVEQLVHEQQQQQQQHDEPAGLPSSSSPQQQASTAAAAGSSSSLNHDEAWAAAGLDDLLGFMEELSQDSSTGQAQQQQVQKQGQSLGQQQKRGGGKRGRKVSWERWLGVSSGSGLAGASTPHPLWLAVMSCRVAADQAADELEGLAKRGADGRLVIRLQRRQARDVRCAWLAR
jgi:hypothetical protein